jgi:hypothetical protein
LSDWPEHSAELARKSLDHFNDQVFAHSQGKLSDAALWLVADTIITVTQGLMPKEEWELIYAVREDIKAKLKKK